MENFEGMVRSTTRDKNPPNTWEFARNILLSKSKTNIVNEDGFDYIHPIPGDFIGKIETNEEIIYFSVDGLFSCIGYYKTNLLGSTYIPVIRSIHLGFKLNRPIEGISFYNYKKELIILFCDGVFLDSNTPKLINVTNIGVDLDVNLELVDSADLGQLELYNQILNADIDTTYLDNGTLEADVAYITYAYVLPDGVSTTAYLPLIEVSYPTTGFRQDLKRNLQIDFTRLDPTYNKLKIGLVIKSNDGIFGYESSIRSYTGTDYSTIVSTLSAFTSVAADSLIIPVAVYNRIRTISTVNSQVVIGNLVGQEEFPFQKYANMLELGLRYDIRNEKEHTNPILCPDDVYAFYISLELLDGSFTKEFHIPGAVANPVNNELVDLTDADLIALGLNDLIGTDTYKRFRIFNTGGFQTLSPIGNPVSSDMSKLNWGYWENQELYPNSDEYNSTIDYTGALLTGQDLRGTNIKYHRVPGLDNLVKGFPCILGYTDRNNPEMIGSTGAFFQGAIPAFAVEVTNFDTIIPAEIRNKIQGYKLSIVKKSQGSSLIEDINFIKQARVTHQDTDAGIQDFMTTPYINDPNSHNYNFSQYGLSYIRSVNLSINKSTVIGKLVKANYGVNSALIRATSGGDGNEEIDTKDFTFIYGNIGGISVLPFSSTVLPMYLRIPDTQRFAVIKDVSYLPGNNIPAGTLLGEETIVLKAHNTLALPDPTSSLPTIPTRWNPLLMVIPDDSLDSITLTIDAFTPNVGYVPYTYSTGSTSALNAIDVSSTFINLLKDVYPGFKPKDFITIGKVSLRTIPNTLSENLIRNCGDTFTHNLYNTIVSRAVGNDATGRIIYNQYVAKGIISTTNNSEVYMTKDRDYGIAYDTSDASTKFSEMLTFNYNKTIFNSPIFNSLNDLYIGILFDIDIITINYFPYRIAFSLKIQSENLSINNVRTFLANSYIDMLNDRGEVVALRGSNKVLYIHQKFSLFTATIKDKLTTVEGTTYLGEGSLFDRTPDEVLDASNKGYIGCTSQFASIIYKDGYICYDQIKGKIFIVNTRNAIEISKQGLSIYFSENSNTFDKYHSIDRFSNIQPLDNPYQQVGYIIGFDDKYNRLLITKKYFRFLKPLNVIVEPFTVYVFDGEWYYSQYTNAAPTVITRLNYRDTDNFAEESKTFSYNLDTNTWICEHDYFPICYPTTNLGLYAISSESDLYKTNSLITKGLYFGVKFKSYVDLIFNTRHDLSKIYQSVSWTTITRDRATNAILFFKTIDAIRLYNNYQCTELIELLPDTLSLDRNVEGVWNFNEFRDMVINRDLPIVDKYGSIIESNINNNRSWFEKSNFIHTFIVVRMIMNNTDNKEVTIQNVNIKSRISDR